MRLPALLVSMVLLSGCSSAPDDAPGDDDGGSQSSVAMPALTGDCTMYVDDDGAQVDLGALRYEAQNCSGLGDLCLMLKSLDGPVDVRWMITFPSARLGEAMDLDQTTPDPRGRLDVVLNVHNTQYQNALGDHPGAIQGALTVSALDPSLGEASLEFTGATLVGADAIYSGTYRCAIDGALTVTGFAHTPEGADCQTDQECGGPQSGVICSDTAFVCETGCHIDDDCPSGHLCESSSCVEHAGASTEEIEACQDACHDLTFFTCIEDEAGCQAQCSVEPRSKVQTFIDCADEAGGGCEAGAACAAAL